MNLPFSVADFDGVFSAYNQAIWPVQIVAWGLGALVAASLFLPGRRASRFILLVLGGLWAWTGVAYHILYFAAINPAAYAFGALFLVQAGLLFAMGLRESRQEFRIKRDFPSAIAAILILYGLAVYPAIGLLVTSPYPATPLFGITPCFLTIFSLGVLLLARFRSRWLLAIPIVWAFIGGTAAFLLAVPQDWLLVGAGIACGATLLRLPRKRSRFSRTLSSGRI